MCPDCRCFYERSLDRWLSYTVQSFAENVMPDDDYDVFFRETIVALYYPKSSTARQAADSTRPKSLNCILCDGNETICRCGNLPFNIGTAQQAADSNRPKCTCPKENFAFNGVGCTCGGC